MFPILFPGHLVPNLDLLFFLSFLNRRIVAVFALCVVIVAGVVPSGVYASEETDRDALVALYRASNGDNWQRNDNWLTNAPIGTWYGVTTYWWSNRVIELDLSNNGLSGNIMVGPNR